MPMQLPTLDDRTYTDLVTEARALLPIYAPEWTNHNPSDPGVMLIELFAYLTELLLYRLDQVTDANVCAFLTLLDGKDRTNNAQPRQTALAQTQQLSADIQSTVRSLRTHERAVTADDFVTLVKTAFPATPATTLDPLAAFPQRPGIARVHCVPQRNLCADYEAEQAGHISVIVVPTVEMPPEQLEQLLTAVRQYLEDRRPLTTYVHVVGPAYLTVGVKATLVLKRDVLLPGEQITAETPERPTMTSEADVREKMVAAIKQFLDPQHGGQEGNGWPFGRNVFVSELYELLDQLPGVDYVPTIMLTAPAARLLKKAVVCTAATVQPDQSVAKEDVLVGVAVRPYELVNVAMTIDDVVIV